jgi:hypothetical protein
LASNSKLYFVKLADSDIGSNAKGAPPEALEARKWSNKSLTALGSCLKAVSDKARIVPVRDSTLTRMLKDSFGQACNIAIVGHCVLADDDAEETVGTLRFIHRLVRQASSSSSGRPASASASKSSNSAPSSRTKGAVSEENDSRRAKTSEGQDGININGHASSPSPYARTSALHRDAGVPAVPHPIQDELARAWTYAFHLENLIVWIAEVFQVCVCVCVCCMLYGRVMLNVCVCIYADVYVLV